MLKDGFMEKKEIILVDEEFRMKVVNFLKIYGYYEGVLAQAGIDKQYVSGDLKLTDIIKSKKDFKELKMSVNKVLDYCYENCFDKIEMIMNKFYQDECAEVRKLYGGFFDKH